jgi:hypothetical protein
MKLLKSISLKQMNNKKYPFILRVENKLYREFYGRWSQCYPSGRFIGTASRRKNVICFSNDRGHTKKR